MFLRIGGGGALDLTLFLCLGRQLPLLFLLQTCGAEFHWDELKSMAGDFFPEVFVDVACRLKNVHRA